jgi:hypothetical protein
MHQVADGLIRLRDEILAWREGRRGLLADLEQETRDRKFEVSRTLVQLSKDSAVVARGMKADRQVTLSNIRRGVSHLRRGVRADLGHVQQAFANLKSPLGDAFPGQRHPQKPEPALRRGSASSTFSAKGKEAQRGFEVETTEGRKGEPEGGKRAQGEGKRRTASRRRR